MQVKLQNVLKKYALILPSFCIDCLSYNPDDKFIDSIDKTFTQIHDFITADPSKIIMGYLFDEYDCHYCDLKKRISNMINICQYDDNCPHFNSPDKHLELCNYSKLFPCHITDDKVKKDMFTNTNNKTIIHYKNFTFETTLNPEETLHIMTVTKLIKYTVFDCSYVKKKYLKVGKRVNFT
jgi:hypothetical protein